MALTLFHLQLPSYVSCFEKTDMLNFRNCNNVSFWGAFPSEVSIIKIAVKSWLRITVQTIPEENFKWNFLIFFQFILLQRWSPSWWKTWTQSFPSTFYLKAEEDSYKDASWFKIGIRETPPHFFLRVLFSVSFYTVIFLGIPIINQRNSDVSLLSN